MMNHYFIHPEGGVVTVQTEERIAYYISGGYVEVSREAYKLHLGFYNLYGDCGLLAANAENILEAERVRVLDSKT